MGDTEIRGSWVAMPTPMHADGSINLQGFLPLIDRQAESGTAALLVGGSAGEVAMLSLEERREIMSFTAKYCLDSIPVYFGTTCSTTEATIDLTRFAQDCGANGAVLTVPSYSLPTQTDILTFLLEVAASVDMGIAIYNNPARVGRNIRPETVAALYREARNFVADKEATADVSQLVSVLELTSGKLPVLACDNPGYSLFSTALTMGSGMANITGNLHPAEMSYLAQPFTQGTDFDEWNRRFLDLLPLMKAAYWLPNPVVIKAALEILGFAVGPPRRPLQPLNGERVSTLKTLLRQQPALAGLLAA